MSDYIKREDAMKIICSNCTDPCALAEKANNPCSAIKELVYLPSADVVSVVRCKDCISRKMAIDAFEPTHYKDWYTPTIIETLEALPSAQPERNKGRWIDGVLPNDNGGLPVQICDQCNTFFPLAYTGGGHRFCPNCGAKMDGDEDDIRR